MDLFLGIDIGTTSLKAAVFDSTGTRYALRCVEYTLHTDAAAGFIEFDPEQYIHMCRRVIDELRQECAAYGQITALSVDTQGETMILTDKDDTPLMPAIVWLDNRAVKEAEDIAAHFGTRRVYEVTGQPEITATWPACKLLWVRNNRPEIFAKIEKIFLLEDWILYRLSGCFVTEPTMQSSTIYYDIHRGTWWQDMLDLIGIRKEQLPTVVKSAARVGDYEGIAVVAGALDQIAGTIGVGVTDDRTISEMTGTIMAICVMKDTPPPYDAQSIVPCHLHAIEGKYCMILWSATAGMALKWFRNQFAEGVSFAELDAQAATVSAGCDGMSMLPYFCGSTIPNYNPEATASFTGITLSHTRAHFVRAIMEAVAFMLRRNLEYVGVPADSHIRITGGAAGSPLWAGMKADVTGQSLSTVSEAETACLGTAILAMVGVGRYESIEEAVDATVKTKQIYTPSGVDYEAAYRRFSALDDLFNKKK